MYYNTLVGDGGMAWKLHWNEGIAACNGLRTAVCFHGPDPILSKILYERPKHGTRKLYSGIKSEVYSWIEAMILDDSNLYIIYL